MREIAGRILVRLCEPLHRQFAKRRESSDTAVRSAALSSSGYVISPTSLLDAPTPG